MLKELFEEWLFARYKKGAQRLRIPVPEAFWTFEVYENGKLVSSRRQRAHSWVRNFYNVLCSNIPLLLVAGTADSGSPSWRLPRGAVQPAPTVLYVPRYRCHPWTGWVWVGWPST